MINQSKKLNILMFNMSKYSDWQKGVVNRNYHVLHNLVKRDEVAKVIAVDFLPFNCRRAFSSYIKDQILKDTRGKVIYGDLTSRCWQVSSKIMVYSTIDSVFNSKRVIMELSNILNKEKMDSNLIVWNYNPMYIDYFYKFNQVANVFDAVDSWNNHSEYKKCIKKLSGNYRIIQEKSELIFTVSRHLKDDLFEGAPHVSWQPNAVDLEYFQSHKEVSEKLVNIPKPIIGFLGVMQNRIDTEILEYLAKKNPKKSLVLAGPVWKEFPKKKLARYKNVHFLGPIDFKEIPAIYNGFDVGIVPYKKSKFIQSIDPMKFYEYLAAGLPVVTTQVGGVDRFRGMVLDAHNLKDFNSLVNKLIIKDNNNPEQVQHFLEKNTWDSRIKDMLDLIYNII